MHISRGSLNWRSQEDIEALRVLHCCQQIASGFFSVNGFVVLPYPAPPGDHIVSLPELAYLTIPHFWQRVKRLDTSTLPIPAPDDLIQECATLLTRTNFPPPTFGSIQQEWTKLQDTIAREIYRLIPSRSGWIKRMVIWPTAFGTTCSFNAMKAPGTVYVWLRNDQGVGAIVEAFITALTRKGISDVLSGNWKESEIIVDWLLWFSPLSKIIPDQPRTIRATRAKQHARLHQQQGAFLHRIGVPTNTPNPFDSLELTSFSSQERKMFALLRSRSPNVVTTDEIADVLFSNREDAFSLYAITKAIERLRSQLEKNGVSGSFIQTKRGEGYMLVESFRSL